ncbi:acyl-CoA dehydratase activase-related protein [Dehalobacterium formicoaceticum]|uniref:acyl-CoA dehydratase activase-related protein n=1 Tax=Dehalobacterium formicoaceticum TaxID=51515 RepID=UPI000B7F1816|nr:acyl-CoA dehydratase activase-related protein [Dehalobacterium formicoaceticum]
MKIGIPKGLLYYRYSYLWKTFFDELDIDYIISPDTNKAIMDKGLGYAIDEACLSSKIYLGHVEYLIGKCDYILVPRISNYGSEGTVCTKFQAIYDIVQNTFRDRGIKLLHYNIDYKNLEIEMNAFLKMGKFLGKRKSAAMRAYYLAKQAEKTARIMDEKHQEQLLNEDKIKILLFAHDYNIFDKHIGKPIIDYLNEMGAVPIIGDLADKKSALAKSVEISDTLPWKYSKELVGSIALYRERVDGIILISSFNCGPDSLVNEIIIRRVKNKPILNLTVDGQEGSAGMETRLESFLDIIKFKKDDYRG